MTRRAADSNEMGSLAIVMMVTIVGLMLSALLLPILITQDRTTRFTGTRVEALGAAQAGIDVAAGQIRASITNVPCVGLGPPDYPLVTGSVNAPPATGAQPDVAAYSYSIAYYDHDPVSEPQAKMSCTLGIKPNYARVTSIGTVRTGTEAGSKRTLSTTFVFQSSMSTDPAGGAIHLAGSASLCMDAGPTYSTLSVQLCANTPQQVFAYSNKLTLQVKASQTLTDPGQCVYAKPDNTVALIGCPLVGDTPLFTQQWSLNPDGEFEASVVGSQINGVLAGLCMTVATSTTPIITLNGCPVLPPNDATYPKEVWSFDASVGAGAAGAPQLASYSEFSKCLAVPGSNTSSDHLYAYPCVQNPWAGKVPTNMKFTTPTIPAGATSAKGLITTTSGSTTYCLTSTTGSPAYVTVKSTPCVVSNPLQNWTVYGGDKSLSAGKRYTIRDGSTPSLYLGIGATVGTDLYKSVVVAAYTGNADQKWNASPNLSTVTLQDTGEN